MRQRICQAYLGKPCPALAERMIAKSLAEAMDQAPWPLTQAPILKFPARQQSAVNGCSRNCPAQFSRLAMTRIRLYCGVAEKMRRATGWTGLADAILHR